jgi:NADH dehydrogenase ubiquinone Fe-S protein 4
MVARIYKPEKSAMQSGKAGTKEWVFEYEPERPQQLDPLMGWAGFGDTRSQVRLEFDTKEEAIAYAKRNGIPFQVIEPQDGRLTLQAYSDNFRYDRSQPWTH